MKFLLSAPGHSGVFTEVISGRITTTSRQRPAASTYFHLSSGSSAENVNTAKKVRLKIRARETDRK